MIPDAIDLYGIPEMLCVGDRISFDDEVLDTVRQGIPEGCCYPYAETVIPRDLTGEAEYTYIAARLFRYINNEKNQVT